MKYDKKEPETMDADPMRLLVSAILAFTVMLLSMGLSEVWVDFLRLLHLRWYFSGYEPVREWKTEGCSRNWQIVRSQDGCCGNMLLVIWFYGGF